MPSVKLRAEASAARLDVHALDLYQVHWPNPLVPDRVTTSEMRSLQRSGLVGEVGVSKYSLERWRGAENALGSRVLSNQVHYSLLDRTPERDLLPFANAHGRVIIAFSPLALGLLSGDYHAADRVPSGIRSKVALFQPDNLRATTDLIATLRAVADVHSATPAQIALAWTVHHPAVVAIPGASTVEQLERNAAAAEIELTDEQYQALSTVSARLQHKAGRETAAQRHRATVR